MVEGGEKLSMMERFNDFYIPIIEKYKLYEIVDKEAKTWTDTVTTQTECMHTNITEK